MDIKSLIKDSKKLMETSADEARRPAAEATTDEKRFALMDHRVNYVLGFLCEQGLLQSEEDLSPTTVALLEVAGMLSVGAGARMSSMISIVEKGRDQVFKATANKIVDGVFSAMAKKPVGSA